jgi:hypothetical protein
MVPYMSGEDLKNSHMPDIVKFGLHDWVAYISRFCVNYMPFKTFLPLLSRPLLCILQVLS